jgi:hypothetical protein
VVVVGGKYGKYEQIAVAEHIPPEDWTGGLFDWQVCHCGCPVILSFLSCTLFLGNKRLVDENKALKADLKEVAKELHLSKLESRDSTQKLERQIEVLEDDLKTQILDSKEALKEHDVEREELKVLRYKTNTQSNQFSSRYSLHDY